VHLLTVGKNDISMKSLENSISVTEADFAYEVVAYSNSRPVLVVFWADWSKPCKLLLPLLEKFAAEYDGAFRLAKVDADAAPTLLLQLSVRTIPTQIGYLQGQRVGDLAGLVPEARIREFIDQLTPPNPAVILVQKGNSLFNAGDINNAQKAFNEALDHLPRFSPAMLGLLKVHLIKGEYAQARAVFEVFPPSPEYNTAESFSRLIRLMEDAAANTLPLETDLDAVFANSLRLAGKGKMFPAIDGLLGLLHQDKHYRKDKAKNALLGLLALLDADSQAASTYREELASIIF
jgi:putative thioredoxin